MNNYGDSERAMIIQDTVEARIRERDAYQGWKNYPTWAVNLWLSNDEGLYHATIERAQEIIRDGNSVGLFSQCLKDWVTNDLAPDLGASFAADLLGYALDSVDWHEIATAWLNEVEA